jgi:hypothetical protein
MARWHQKDKRFAKSPGTNFWCQMSRISVDSFSAPRLPQGPLLVRLPAAAAITGIPLGWLEKSFMANPPKGTPPRPPHVRIGKAIYIIAERLQDWVRELQSIEAMNPPVSPRKPGRPSNQEKYGRRGRH